MFEGGTANSSGLRQHYPTSLDNMKPSWIEFYRHWYRLTVEEISYEQNKDICGKIWRRNVLERYERLCVLAIHVLIAGLMMVLVLVICCHANHNHLWVKKQILRLDRFLRDNKRGMSVG